MTMEYAGVESDLGLVLYRQILLQLTVENAMDNHNYVLLLIFRRDAQQFVPMTDSDFAQKTTATSDGSDTKSITFDRRRVYRDFSHEIVKARHHSSQNIQFTRAERLTSGSGCDGARAVPK